MLTIPLFIPLVIRSALAAALLAAAFPAPGQGQEQAQAQGQAQGEAVFQRNCASCHGADRQGTGLGPPLSAQTYRYGGTRGDLARIIRNGIPSQGMPAFGEQLSAAEIEALVDFLPSRERAEEEEEAPPRERVFDPVPGVVETLDYAVRTEVFADGLQTVWAMAFIDARTALVSERTGRLRIIRDGVLQPQPVSATPEVYVSSHRWNQGGLLDVAIDPDYADNGWIYLSHSHRIPGTGPEGQPLAMLRVVRGRIRDNTWVDEEVLFQAAPETYGEPFWHYAGRMAFDNEGRLYFSVGDRGVQELAREPGRPTGKIHRIMPDGSIPADNPLRNRDGALPTVYSLGHRNPQGMVFDAESGRLWATEHGPRGGDELNLVRAGADYGWPVTTYGINYNGTVLTPHTRAPGVTQPVHYWRPSIGVSGVTVYRGSQFPLWEGKLLVTGLGARELRLLTLDGDRVLHEETLLRTQGRPYEPVVGPDGAIYLVTDDPGQILRLSIEEERRR
ncbi:PQQ-dependent sugar dehydrogenase [Pseudoxanthomonas suwonensis]|uniref:PQQ-dependent sugar dehydrogenase n=1 Tax=Pseudoxanthomonas suwonensis TaxID=314722 RepID=UPI00046778FD|nr:PQQ-dependent sugar dehydrogenase [Pseudoxanthomonas suwonensis]